MHQVWWLPLACAGAVATVLLCSATLLTQSDGDLFAHIALGREILAHGVPTRVTPAWGSATLLAVVHEAGGLPLITVLTAVIAALTHGLAVESLQRAGLSPRSTFLTAVITFTMASSHWLARPHAFTLLGVAIVMAVLPSRRRIAWVALVPLFALWANLHGGWVFGWLVLCCHTVGRAVSIHMRSTRTPDMPLSVLLHERRWLWGVTAGALVATMATPYGLALHRTVWHTLTDPAVAKYVDEYRPPTFATPVDAVFLTIILAAIPVLLRLRRPLAWSSTLILLLSAAAALRAGRNISLFAFTGWPLLAVHVVALVPAAQTKKIRARQDHVRATTQRVIIGAALLLVSLLGVLRFSVLRFSVLRFSVLRFSVPIDPARFPVQAVAQAQRAGLAGPVLTTWSWSGYVPFAWRNHRAWFDPLAFSSTDLHILRTLLLVGPRWRATLDSLGIRVVMLPRTSSLGAALANAPGWFRWYEDGTSVVYRHVGTGMLRQTVPRVHAEESTSRKLPLPRVRFPTASANAAASLRGSCTVKVASAPKSCACTSASSVGSNCCTAPICAYPTSKMAVTVSTRSATRSVSSASWTAPPYALTRPPVPSLVPP